jgi:hypothetical protein
MLERPAARPAPSARNGTRRDLTARQRELFDNASGAAIDTPRWPDLPRETRRTLTELLARLLLDHADQNVAGCVTEIGRDL